jgi:hypothetical protein
MQSWADCITGTLESSFWKRQEKTILRILGSGMFSHSFGQMQKSTGLTLSTVWADALPVKQSEETPCPPN